MTCVDLSSSYAPRRLCSCCRRARSRASASSTRRSASSASRSKRSTSSSKAKTFAGCSRRSARACWISPSSLPIFPSDWRNFWPHEAWSCSCATDRCILRSSCETTEFRAWCLAVLTSVWRRSRCLAASVCIGCEACCSSLSSSCSVASWSCMLAATSASLASASRSCSTMPVSWASMRSISSARAAVLSTAALFADSRSCSSLATS
mmetsp:Transcript_102146/g.293126  ORF Transcript_102146/g.293126 Transcript_102146/m.293126 type:complete len:207 (+) Transcript_102146:63-683(+)